MEKTKINYKTNFAKIEEVARASFGALVREWLPDGTLQGREWMPKNPTRNDRSSGSFRINMDTANFYDFATDEGGRGVISLYAYLNKLSRYQAAQALAQRLGVKNDR